MKRHSGFTLIELMIAVAVAGIILAIAVPAFTEQMRKSRRSDAIGGLGDLQLRQERWRANHATYGTGVEVGLPTSSHYDFAVTGASISGTDVEMTAAPKGAQADDRCGTFKVRIDNDNNSAPSGPVDKTTSTSYDRCW